MKTCKTGCGGKMTMSKDGKVAPVKKMAKGGVTDIVGMPKYGNNPRTQEGRMLKEGGSASLPVCRGGLVRMPDGSCGTREKTFKKGGAIKNAKLAALAAPKNKITRADIIAGAKKNAAKKK
jgi:hypothetical protein